MQFNQYALEQKKIHLDEIKSHPEIIERVMRRNLNAEYEIIENPRIWLGGGGTSYVVNSDIGKLFIKVKHKAVTVESKLEKEEKFIDEPCIEHEKIMLEKAKAVGVNVPKVVFFDSDSDFQFLAMEYIEESLDHALRRMSLEGILSLWDDLEQNVHKLFETGIIHSDLHEYNLRCSNDRIVLIDFEEARDYKQDCEFENSLDYVGSDGYSSLGLFPYADEQKYSVKINSLLRMKQVFKDYVVPKTREYLKECNYDSSNGICTALDHGKSDLVYQSIHNSFIDVRGQRDTKDNRPILIAELMKSFSMSCDATFIDVGSNNGFFCRFISSRFEGANRCIGLEGFHKFNVLANALAFIEDIQNVEYYDFICGESSLESLNIQGNCIVSMCSVWHHIKNRGLFLEQLKGLKIQFIFLEMPVQSECYSDHTWEEEVNSIKNSIGFQDDIILGYSRDYIRPLVLISKERLSDEKKEELYNIGRSILKPSLWDKLKNYLIKE